MGKGELLGNIPEEVDDRNGKERKGNEKKLNQTSLRYSLLHPPKCV